MVKFLLEKGAKVNTQNNIGCTALHIASEDGYLGVVRLLIERGANIDTQNNKGVTALHVASL